VDGSLAYRNGYGKERKLTLGCGTITLRRPRVRGLEERFESRVLPLFARRAKGVSKLIPQLYLHGLALGDFALALRGLLGENAPVSASTVARLKAEWQAEWHEWKQRSLAGLQVVYVWVDGVYVKAGLEKEKAALLVVIGALLDGRKVILAVEPG
jgi:transposase-like protein